MIKKIIKHQYVNQCRPLRNEMLKFQYLSSRPIASFGGKTYNC
jgi:hypothetical protein